MRAPAIIRQPALPADSVVIWLHGLGASGDDFVPVIPHLGLDAAHAVRFIFPNAPDLPVTINGGIVMPAWYDILSLGLDREVDSEQLLRSADEIRQLIDEQIAQGIDSRRIILAGFSQGGAVAYHCALSYPKPLGGLLALSTYFATPQQTRLHPSNAELPIQVYHGSQDDMVSPQLAQTAVAQLKELGLSPQSFIYPMEHQVCLEQIIAIGAFINRVLSRD